MKTLRSQKRAAARRCEEIGAQVGQRIVIRSYRSHFHQPDDIVILTAIGMSSVLVKPKRGNEFQISEPDKIVGVYRLETLSFTFVPDK